MKLFHWELDPNTQYWAEKCPLEIKSQKPHPQYDGREHDFWETTWKEYILEDRFPDYCQIPEKPGCILPNPENIITCLQEEKYLEGLALIVAWGTMVRTQNKIYTLTKENTEIILAKVTKLIEREQSIENAWNLLIHELHWTQPMTSKYLHFQTRALGFNANPPVPFDRAVIYDIVRKKFFDNIENEISDTHPINKIWWDDFHSWEPYNRYMTAILTWADLRKWTTTEVENTIYKE